MLANAKDTSDIPNIKTSRVQSPTQAVAQSIAPPLFEWTAKLGIGKPPANILSSSPNVETWIEVRMFSIITANYRCASFQRKREIEIERI